MQSWHVLKKIIQLKNPYDKSRWKAAFINSQYMENQRKYVCERYILNMVDFAIIV